MSEIRVTKIEPKNNCTYFVFTELYVCVKLCKCHPECLMFETVWLWHGWRFFELGVGWLNWVTLAKSFFLA